jgi:hypothetical protein
MIKIYLIFYYMRKENDRVKETKEFPHDLCLVNKRLLLIYAHHPY